MTENATEQGKCKTCRWWSKGETLTRLADDKVVDAGECRRHAPIPGTPIRTPFDYWCGEHAAKAETRCGQCTDGSTARSRLAAEGVCSQCKHDGTTTCPQWNETPEDGDTCCIGFEHKNWKPPTESIFRERPV